MLSSLSKIMNTLIGEDQPQQPMNQQQSSSAFPTPYLSNQAPRGMPSLPKTNYNFPPRPLGPRMNGTGALGGSSFYQPRPLRPPQSGPNFQSLQSSPQHQQSSQVEQPLKPQIHPAQQQPNSQQFYPGSSQFVDIHQQQNQPIQPHQQEHYQQLLHHQQQPQQHASLQQQHQQHTSLQQQQHQHTSLQQQQQQQQQQHTSLQQQQHQHTSLQQQQQQTQHQQQHQLQSQHQQQQSLQQQQPQHQLQQQHLNLQQQTQQQQQHKSLQQQQQQNQPMLSYQSSPAMSSQQQSSRMNMNQTLNRLQQNAVPEEPNLDLSHLSAEERNLIQTVMAKAKDMDYSQPSSSYPYGSSSPSKQGSQVYQPQPSMSSSNRWEKEYFGENQENSISNDFRKPGDDKYLSEYSNSRQRYKNELVSKQQRTLNAADPKSEFIEKEEEEEIEEEMEEEEDLEGEEEETSGNNLTTNEGKETVRKYFERASADVYTIPEEEDEISSPTCGDGVTSLRRPIIGGRGIGGTQQLGSSYSTLQSNSPQRILSKENTLQSLSSIQNQDLQYNTNKDLQYNTSKDLQYNTSKDLQYNTSKDLQYNTSKDMQYNTNKDLQYNTSKDMQYNTSKDLQYNTSKDLQYNTNKDLQYNTSNQQKNAPKIQTTTSNSFQFSPISQDVFQSATNQQTDLHSSQMSAPNMSPSKRFNAPFSNTSNVKVDNNLSRMNYGNQSKLKDPILNESEKFGAHTAHSFEKYRSHHPESNFMENEIDELGFPQNRISTTKPGTISGMLADFSRALGLGNTSPSKTAPAEFGNDMRTDKQDGTRINSYQNQTGSINYLKGPVDRRHMTIGSLEQQYIQQHQNLYENSQTNGVDNNNFNSQNFAKNQQIFSNQSNFSSNALQQNLNQKNMSQSGINNQQQPLQQQDLIAYEQLMQKQNALLRQNLFQNKKIQPNAWNAQNSPNQSNQTIQNQQNMLQQHQQQQQQLLQQQLQQQQQYHQQQQQQLQQQQQMQREQQFQQEQTEQQQKLQQEQEQLQFNNMQGFTNKNSTNNNQQNFQIIQNQQLLENKESFPLKNQQMQQLQQQSNTSQQGARMNTQVVPMSNAEYKYQLIQSNQASQLIQQQMQMQQQQQDKQQQLHKQILQSQMVYVNNPQQQRNVLFAQNLTPQQQQMYEQHMQLQHHAQHLKKIRRSMPQDKVGVSAVPVLMQVSGNQIVTGIVQDPKLVNSRLGPSMNSMMYANSHFVSLTPLNTPLNTPAGTPRGPRDTCDSSDTMSETDSLKSLQLRRKLPPLPADQEAAPLPTVKRREQQKMRSVSEMKIRSYSPLRDFSHFSASNLLSSRASSSETNLCNIMSYGSDVHQVPRPGSALGLLQGSSFYNSSGVRMGAIDLKNDERNELVSILPPDLRHLVGSSFSSYNRPAYLGLNHASLKPHYKSYEYESIDDSNKRFDWEHDGSSPLTASYGTGGLRETAITSLDNDSNSRFAYRRHSDGFNIKSRIDSSFYKPKSWQPSPCESDGEDEMFCREDKKAKIKAEIARRRQQIEENARLHDELLRLARLREKAEMGYEPSSTGSKLTNDILGLEHVLKSIDDYFQGDRKKSNYFSSDSNKRYLKRTAEDKSIDRIASTFRTNGHMSRVYQTMSQYSPMMDMTPRAMPLFPDMHSRSRRILDDLGSFPLNDIYSLVNKNNRYSHS